MVLPDVTQQQPSRILFASCNSQHYNAVLWDPMTARNASTFVWVGDAVYGDDFYPSSTKVREATPTVLNDLYQELLQDGGYTKLTGRTVGDNKDSYRQGVHVVLGTFDDHDYGINNGDRNYQFSTESARSYVEFLQASTRNDSQMKVDLTIMKRRADAGAGVYGVKVLDFRQPTGMELLSDAMAGLEPSVRANDDKLLPLSDRSVAVFLLDCRSKKSPWKRDFPSKFHLDFEGDFLGREQWEWLESSLTQSSATVNVIVQGLQVHADRYYDGNLVENWSRFPMAQHRLYQTILNSNVSAPLLVSGDVHMAELLLKDCRRYHPDSSLSVVPPTTRRLLEVTTSGMTHSWCTNICARPSSSICRVKWFQRALCAGMHWAHWSSAWTELVHVPTPHQSGSKKGVQYTLQRNFAEMEFDWDHRQVIVRVLDESSESTAPLLSTAWDLDSLSGTVKPMTGVQRSQSDFVNLYKRLSLHGARPNDWICVSNRGTPSAALKLYGFLSPMLLAASLMLLPAIAVVLTLFIVRRRLIRARNTGGKHEKQS